MDWWSDLLFFPGNMDNKLRQMSLLEYLSKPVKNPVYFDVDGDSDERSLKTHLEICVDCAITLGMPRLLIFRPRDLDPVMISKQHPDYVVSTDSDSTSTDSTSTSTDSSDDDGDVCGSTASDEEDEDSDDNDFIVDDDETVTVHSSTTYVGGLLPHKEKKKYDDSTDSSDSSSTTS